MARKKSKTSKIAQWYNIYRDALRYQGIELKELKRPTVLSLAKAKKTWQRLKKDLKKNYGEVLERPQTYAKKQREVDKIIEESIDRFNDYEKNYGFEYPQYKDDFTYSPTDSAKPDYLKEPRDENMDNGYRPDPADTFDGMDYIEDLRSKLRELYTEGLENLPSKSAKLTEEYDKAMDIIDAMLETAGGDADYVADKIHNNKFMTDFVATALDVKDSDQDELLDASVGNLTSILTEISEEFW